MKGEILRRMSMETVKDDNGHNNPVKKKKDKKKTEDGDDYLVKTIGPFGLWQTVVSVTVMLTRAIALCNTTSISFLAPVVEFVCVEFSDNITTEVINSTCYDNCLKYKYTNVIRKSIIEEFGLICQNAWMASVTQSIFMLGLLFGVSLFGWISDRFGRRMAMLQSTFLNAVFMIALPYSPNYIIFTCIRFVISVATGGSLLICVVQVMEIIGNQYREIAGSCFFISDVLAEASLAGFVYFTSNWQGYTLSYGVATCFIFVLIWFVPESPRWLVTQGKVDEAIKVITQAANRNKFSTSHIKAEIMQAVEEVKLKNCDGVKPSYLDFFTSKALFILTLTVFTMWFALGMCYFGIYQYVTITGVDPYLTVVILGLIQIPFCPMGIIINREFGRRISTIGITTTIAITMLILTFVPKGQWPGTILGVLAFVCCKISFTIAYIYMTELYPTPLRNMSFALSSGGAWIGAMIVPFVAKLSPGWLPSLVFCVFPIVTGLCCFALPETKGCNLKDTIEK